MPEKKIYDKQNVMIGLVIFVCIVSFPFWYNLFLGSAESSPVPVPELSEKAKKAGVCILSKNEMKSGHMQILDLWREEVVRNANRVYVTPEGRSYNMSLSNTCLDCHSNKEKFCDKCHNYASVTPYCWDCHIDKPQGEN